MVPIGTYRSSYSLQIWWCDARILSHIDTSATGRGSQTSGNRGRLDFACGEPETSSPPLVGKVMDAVAAGVGEFVSPRVGRPNDEIGGERRLVSELWRNPPGNVRPRFFGWCAESGRLLRNQSGHGDRKPVPGVQQFWSRC